jgi:hypothetical protein
MAIMNVLLAGATALTQIRSAFGLGARLSQSLEPSSGLPFTSDELLAAGKDADALDDFDTWYFEQAEKRSMLFKTGSGHPAHVSAEEKLRVAAASQQCSRDRASTLESGVITYLVTRESDLDRLGESLPRLRYFFLRHWAYDVKVFIPDDALREYDAYSFEDSPNQTAVEEVLRKHLGEGYNWEVAPFDLKFPKVISDDANWTQKLNVCAKAVSTSYKHMNQFFTKVMYEHPALDKYRYYLRIDADFAFMAELENDPFCMMAKTGRKFMWQTRKQIWVKECSHGLWDWFQEYQQTHGLTPQDPAIWNEHLAEQVYVGYAGMGDLDFFRSEPVRKLAEAFNEDGRVYLNRWSDQTYYPLVFALLEPHSSVGDNGFDWGPSGAYGRWCHKCTVDLPFNTVTGKNQPSDCKHPCHRENALSDNTLAGTNIDLTNARARKAASSQNK